MEGGECSTQIGGICRWREKTGLGHSKYLSDVGMKGLRLGLLSNNPEINPDQIMRDLTGHGSLFEFSPEGHGDSVKGLEQGT